jgi:hypothetical protein
VGEYAGSWDFEIIDDAGTVTLSASCDCDFTVPTQQGNVFFGRSAAAAPCDVIIPLSDGWVEASGQIRFQLRTDFFGGACDLTSQPPLSGTYSSGRISVSRTEDYDCMAVDGHTYEATIRLNVAR